MGILDDLQLPCFYEEGMVEIDYSSHTIAVTGLVEKELRLSLADIKSIRKTIADARLTSVSGWSARVAWGGALFSDFMKVAKPLPEATHATFASVGGYETTVAISDLLAPRTLLCWEAGGEELPLKYGGPARMIIPSLWGYKSCKGLASIEFCDSMRGGYWEDRGYPRDAAIKPGKTLDVNSRQIIEITGGEVLYP